MRKLPVLGAYSAGDPLCHGVAESQLWADLRCYCEHSQLLKLPDGPHHKIFDFASGTDTFLVMWLLRFCVPGADSDRVLPCFRPALLCDKTAWRAFSAEELRGYSASLLATLRSASQPAPWTVQA